MPIDELIDKIQNGHEELLEVLWEAVNRFIRAVAVRYLNVSGNNCGCEIEDLVQSGYIAMVSAVKTYNKADGSKFTTWLVYHLKREFSSAMGLVHTTDDSGRQKKKVSFLDAADSLDKPIPGEDEDIGSIVDTIPDPADPFEETERKIFIEQLHEALDHLLDTLPAAEADTIRGTFFDGESQNEIASRRGISIARVGQIKKSGLRRLKYNARAKPEGKALEEFLDEETNFYAMTGLTAYRNNNNSSSVELLAIRRERLANTLDNF